MAGRSRVLDREEVSVAAPATDAGMRSAAPLLLLVAAGQPPCQDRPSPPARPVASTAGLSASQAAPDTAEPPRDRDSGGTDYALLDAASGDTAAVDTGILIPAQACEWIDATVLARDDLKLAWSELHGSAHAGGHLSLEGCPACAERTTQPCLSAGTRLELTAGDLFGNAAWMSGVQERDVTHPSWVSIYGGSPFRTSQRVDTLARAIARLSAKTGAPARIVSSPFQGPTLQLETGHRVRVSAEQRASVQDIELHGRGVAVVVVDGEHIELNVPAPSLPPEASAHLAWVFVDAGHLTLRGTVLPGTLVAPHAHVHLRSAVLSGQLVGRQITGSVRAQHVHLTRPADGLSGMGRAAQRYRRQPSKKASDTSVSRAEGAASPGRTTDISGSVFRHPTYRAQAKAAPRK